MPNEKPVANPEEESESESESESDSDSDSESDSSSSSNSHEITSTTKDEDDYNKTPDDEVEDELVKRIRDAKKKAPTHPPTIIVEEGVQDICFHPVNDYLAVALTTGDVNIYLYDLTENKLFDAHELHSDSCRDVEFSEDGNTLFTASLDKSIMITDVNNGRLKGCFENAHDHPLYCLRLVGEHLFVTADDSGFVKMWDDRQRETVPIFNIQVSDNFIPDMLTNSSGKYLVCACGDGVVYTINMNARKLYTQSQGIKSEIVALGLFRNETKLLAAAGNGTMQIYNWEQFDTVSDEFPKLKEPCFDILPITENAFAMAGGDGVIRAAHMFPHRHLGVIGKHVGYSVDKLDISNNGEYIASYSSMGDVKFWNISFFEDLDINTAQYKKNKKENLRQNLPSSNMANASDFFSGLA